MKGIGICMLSLALLQTTAQLGAQDLTYPKTKKVDQVDEYFGVAIPDPYRWLEDDVRNSDEVRQWVEAENKITMSYLESLPYRQEIEDRLTKLWDYEKYGTPFRRGGRYFYSKNDGLQNQSVIYKMDSLDGEPTVLIDPNKWSKDGTVALGGMGFSDDGKYVAYAAANAGSDWKTWKVMEIESGKVLDDEIEWIKWGSVAWTKDNKGFFYSRFPEPEEGEEFQGLNKNQEVYYHVVGTAQADDKSVLKTPDHPDWGFEPQVTEDGKFVVVTVWVGTAEKFRIKYRRLDQEGSEWTDLIDNFDNEFAFAGNEGDVMYFKSDWNAPTKCVVAININHPEKENWRVLIPKAEDTLSGISMVGDMIIANYLKDAKTQIKIFGLDGKFVREVKFPGIGTASGFGGKRRHDETFYSFSSFNTPPRVFRYDLKTGESKLLREAKVDFDPEKFTVKQVFYNSKDGTRIPMFIAHRKGLEYDGTNPTLLYGYGGFNISLTPGFSISRLQWMEMGGVFAMPNLRGGGEYGEEWHQAGTKTRKQNVFDDFIAAAEYLIEEKYTSSENLAIQGGSNGGLLVGACMAQRPDLYGACLPAVGVMDMLRFDKFTAGRYWTDDYGSSTKSKPEFDALVAYSPYHNLHEGTEYPPTMVTTADTDDRVVPGHSFKFAARLQECQAGNNPTLIRIETKAGHGAGKPTAKIIEEVADQWAFLAKHLDLVPDLKQE
ncbi:prolyl oligopeptidase family serine peptidase [Vicingaceae bacterium]|nr:prolyl oligopeptidase family serine peptidase [Vicingaceae bacterium]